MLKKKLSVQSNSDAPARMAFVAARAHEDGKRNGVGFIEGNAAKSLGLAAQPGLRLVIKARTIILRRRFAFRAHRVKRNLNAHFFLVRKVERKPAFYGNNFSRFKRNIKIKGHGNTGGKRDRQSAVPRAVLPPAGDVPGKLRDGRSAILGPGTWSQKKG